MAGGRSGEGGLLGEIGGEEKVVEAFGVLPTFPFDCFPTP